MKFKTLVIITLLGTFLTIIFTYPLVLKIETYFDESGDLALCFWILNHTFEAIKSGEILNQSQYFPSGIFFPLKNTFAFSEHMFIPGLIYSSIRFIFQNLVTSFNLFLMSTFILTFISSFYVINKLVKNKLAAIIGATIFTFNPLTFAHFPGHVQLMNKYFLPLVFYFAIKFFSKPDKKLGLLLGLFFTLNALSSIYYQFFSLIMVMIIFCIYLQNFKKIFKFLPLFLPFILILLWFNLPYIQVSKQYSLIRTISDIKPLSANLNAWILPSKHNLIFGNLITQPFQPERTIFPGFIASILGLFGIIHALLRKEKRRTEKLIIYSSFFTLIISFILTFGPNFKQINLPFYYLFNYFPFFKAIRAPSRFAFIFYITFSIFVAYATKKILNNRFHKTIFVFLLLILTLENLNHFDYFTQKPMYSMLKIYQAQNSKIFSILNNKSTLHLPVMPSGREDSEAQYLVWPIFTNEKMMNGYSGFRPKDTDILLKDVNAGLTINKLKEFKSINLNYIVLHKNLFKSKPPKINLPVIFQDKNISIFKI
jgi:hypothetical protein